MTSPLPDWPYPRLIAHRGAGRLAPENTMAAFRLGAAFGYRMFECDVKLSADDVPFLLHDATLDRTTDGRGKVALCRWEALVGRDAGSWHGAAFAGERLPTLDELAAWCRAHAHMINLEIKPVPGAATRTGRCVARRAAQLWQGAWPPPLLSSFSEKALIAAQRAAPGLPRMLLLQALPGDMLSRVAALGCIGLVVEHSLVTASVIADAHAHGLRIACYTANEPSRVRQLLDWGIDAVITDSVDLIGADTA